MGWDSDPVYEYKNNKHYIKFTKKKEDIKKNYPPDIFDLKPTSGRTSKYIDAYNKEYVDKHRSLHKEYLKELADLIFQPNGEFQEFTWDMISEKNQLDMQRIARGRKLSKSYLGE